jgi:hypothetical protein
MGSFRDSRSRALAQLKLQLEDAGRLLDEIEKRSRYRRTGRASQSVSIDRLSNLISENPETRFAACVASGMSKLRAPVKSLK